MNRAERREQSQNKFISRIKMWFQIEGRINNKTWEEYLKGDRWLNKHKHNKFRHRSNMSNMEKHKTNKQIRQSNIKEIENSINENE